MQSTDHSKIVLLGDVGGTKALLQIVAMNGAEVRVLREERFACRHYDNFVDLLGEFLRREAHPHAPDVACLGIAGPVSNQVVKVTNLPWEIDAKQISAQFRIPRVRLLNDFEALAHGIDALSEADLVTLQRGAVARDEPRAIIGAGTGLGAAFMVWGEDGYRVVPIEIGRTGFAPADSLQADLWRYLNERFGKPNAKMVLSGAGLVSIYEFVCQRLAVQPRPRVQSAGEDEDPAATVTRLGLDGDDRAAASALDLFLSIYGSRAGDLALTVLAKSGVYVAGGMAPKLLPRLRSSPFLKAFNDKDAFSSLMANMPVHVVLNERTGLLGAAAVVAGVTSPHVAAL